MNSEGITIKAEGHSYQLKKRDKQHLYHHSTAPTSLFVAYVKILHDVFVMIPRCLGSGRKQMSLWKFCFIFSDRLTSSSIFFSLLFCCCFLLFGRRSTRFGAPLMKWTSTQNVRVLDFFHQFETRMCNEIVVNFSFKD